MYIGPRQYGVVTTSQLFLWRKQNLTAVAAGKQVVPASELAAALKQIKESPAPARQKMMENKLIQEAVEYGRTKNGYHIHPYRPGMGNQLRPLLSPSVVCTTTRHSSDEPMTGKMVAITVTLLMIRMCFSVYTMSSKNSPRMVIIGYGLCFADKQNLMAYQRSTPNVFTSSCAMNVLLFLIVPYTLTSSTPEQLILKLTAHFIPAQIQYRTVLT